MKIEVHNPRAVLASTVLAGSVFIYKGNAVMKTVRITAEDGDVFNAVDLTNGHLHRISDSTSVMLPSDVTLQVEI